ncbi:MAG TPA: circularly permuted type 2 ATP-grasp protein, partial [Myxococcales bacterium]|nr:circularly permuted type 2 ATP-grasp protein [Myxococcales bacterium]
MSLFESYRGLPGAWDELFEEGGACRAGFERTVESLGRRTAADFERQQALAERALLNQGVTFSVYKDDRGTERIFPLCLLPRLIAAAEWSRLAEGLQQRLRALSFFLDDVYGEQRILAEGKIPRELVLGAKQYLQILRGIPAPGGVRIHVSGIDLIRDPAGTFRVLEDNLRTPSGVSYVLENRLVSKRVLPRTMDVARVQRVDDYPARLAETLASVSPVAPEESTLVVLTPGPYNSAYFEHSFLAREMGVTLVEGRDLVVKDGAVCMRTTDGLRRVDVIYRRIDDDFLDPVVFRPDSILGCPGLFGAYRSGQVALANAPGTGVADDKAIYPFVPDMIRYYMNEEPILPNVKTYIASRELDRKYILDHLDELVVKQTDASGGYGMLIGTHSTAAERDDFRRR